MKRRTFRREPIDYGQYRVGRVIWITTLKDETLVKCDVLDLAGNVLYRVKELPGDLPRAIIREGITQEQIEDIQSILDQAEMYFDWYDGDIDGTLSYFGCMLARIESLREYSMDSKMSAVSYDVYSSIDDIEPVSEMEFYEDETLTREELEKQLVLKLLAHDEVLDTIEMKFSKNGTVSAYRLVLE